jgi:hypothetical protein
VHQADFGGDGRGLGEMIDQLLVCDAVMINIFGFECPFEVKAWRVRIFVFNPSSFLKGLFQKAVSS